jgi:hypothetical protein
MAWPRPARRRGAPGGSRERPPAAAQARPRTARARAAGAGRAPRPAPGGGQAATAGRRDPGTTASAASGSRPVPPSPRRTACRLLHQCGIVSNSRPLPRKRRAIAPISRCTSSGSRYISSPWAVTSTPRSASTASIQRASSAEHAIRRRRRRGQQLAGDRRGLGQLDPEPLDPAVVDAPELRLEPFPPAPPPCRRDGPRRSARSPGRTAARAAPGPARAGREPVRSARRTGSRSARLARPPSGRAAPCRRAAPPRHGGRASTAASPARRRAQRASQGPDDLPRTWRASGRTNHSTTMITTMAPE